MSFLSRMLQTYAKIVYLLCIVSEIAMAAQITEKVEQMPWGSSMEHLYLKDTNPPKDSAARSILYCSTIVLQ